MRNDLGYCSVPSSAVAWPRNRDNSDQALVAKIAAGNTLAMQVLFARHHTRVYRFILRLVGDAALAENLASEVFLSMWQQARRFEARSTVSTWLLAIARYKAMAELRRRSDEPADRQDKLTANPSNNPELAFEVKHRGEILRKCLTRLAREHREIIDLVYYHEKSMEEVAEIIGVPRDTVKTRMCYARRKLSQLLDCEA